MENSEPQRKPFVLRIEVKHLKSGVQFAVVEHLDDDGDRLPIHSWMGTPYMDPDQMNDMVSCINRVLWDFLAIQLQFPTDIR